MGDPAGIGPDITLAAWASRRRHRLAPFACLAAPAVLADRARGLGIDVPITEIGRPDEAAETFDQALPVLPVPCPPVDPGRPDDAASPAVIAAIERAAGLALAGEAGAVVTNPIAKSVLARSGFSYPGHTEFLAALSARGGPPPRPVMMLASPALRVVPVTIHIALRDVPAALSSELIVDVTRIAADGLRRTFAIARPRLALAGLNPHAGEDGLMGDEDERIVRPAVAELVASGIDAVGPLPADTLFHDEARERYDAAVCMYHDQALIPIKTLAFDTAVNVTLGLPFLRTSPDHGTAFAIAGSGRARETSLVAALRLAADHAAHAREPAAAIG